MPRAGTPSSKISCVERGARLLVDRRRPAGEHEGRRVLRPDLLSGDRVRDELGVDSGLAHSACDELRVLRPKIDDENGPVPVVRYFCHAVPSWRSGSVATADAASAASFSSRNWFTSRAIRTSRKNEKNGITPPSASTRKRHEVPTHRAPQHEVRDEVDDVEPAVGDEDRLEEIKALADELCFLAPRARRQELRDAVRREQEQLHLERVPHNHDRAEQQEHDAGDDRGDLVYLHGPPNTGVVFGLRLELHDFHSMV